MVGIHLAQVRMAIETTTPRALYVEPMTPSIPRITMATTQPERRVWNCLKGVWVLTR